MEFTYEQIKQLARERKLHLPANKSQEDAMAEQEIIEQLADKVHASWSHWMKYLFLVSRQQEDGSVIIPPAFVERWQRQMETPYHTLSEAEKQSDRNQAVKLLPIIRACQTTE